MDNHLEFWFRILSADSPPIGRIICLAERDNTYHVESHFRGEFFSAHFTEGVRITDQIEHDDDPAGYWEIIRVPAQVTDQIQAWAESICGAKYDTMGAINSALGIPLHDPYRWFCSLVAGAVASRAGILGIDPLPSPSELRYQLKCHLAEKTFASALLSAVKGEIPRCFPVPGLEFGDEDYAYVHSLVAGRQISVALKDRLIQACGGKA